MVIQLAKDRNPKVIAELEEILERETTHASGDEAITVRTDFHAGHRPAIRQDPSGDERHAASRHREGQPLTATHQGRPRQTARRRSAKTHRMLLEHIKAGDVDKAADLWSRHLKKAEEYVLAGSELSTVVDLLERARRPTSPE